MNSLLQGLSLAGAGLILIAYLALQQRWWRSDDRVYLWFNLLGAFALTIVATVDRRAGFIVLEGVWAVVSLISLVRLNHPAVPST
jgi:hypothetical protein